jgi:hypothetical protein
VSDLFRDLDEALLKVISVVRDRVVRGDMSREDLIHFLEVVEERIRSLVDSAGPPAAGDLSVHERRQLARGLGSRLEKARTAMNEFLESYFAEEMNRPDKPQ